MITRLNEQDKVSKRELIREGTNASGCRLTTSRNYMEAATAKNGFLQEVEVDGNKIIVFREDKE